MGWWYDVAINNDFYKKYHTLIFLIEKGYNTKYLYL